MNPAAKDPVAAAVRVHGAVKDMEKRVEGCEKESII